MINLIDKNGKMCKVYPVDLKEWLDAKAVSSYGGDDGKEVIIESEKKPVGRPPKAE
jgi:hypothetical protein